MNEHNKYNARKRICDGITFDSIAEYSHYCELKLLEQAGVISGLTVHPRYIIFDEIDKHGKREVIRYEPDFVYQENGATIAEDVKGGKATQTDVFRIKAKMFRVRYPDIELRIVK